jgi:hypothetical protein
MLSEPEMVETVEVLSPQERQAAHEFAATISNDLTVNGQQPAAWVEIAAWLLATQIDRCRAANAPELVVPKLKEFIGRRAEQILAEWQETRGARS